MVVRPTLPSRIAALLAVTLHVFDAAAQSDAGADSGPPETTASPNAALPASPTQTSAPAPMPAPLPLPVPLALPPPPPPTAHVPHPEALAVVAPAALPTHHELNPAMNLITGRPGHGVTLSTGDDLFGLTLRGRMMLRDTLVVPTHGTATNEISVRRARLVVSGHTFSRNIQYYMQLSLSNQDQETDLRLPLLDAYITLTHIRDLNVRIGQFIVPFDRVRVISSSVAQMVDRSIVVSELNLDRDVGVQVFSSNLFGLGNRLAYQLGVFGGEGRNRLAAPLGFLYTARLQFNPFGAFDDYVEGDLTRLSKPRLSIGAGAAYNQNTNRVRSTTGGVNSTGFDYTHAEIDAIFKYRGFSLMAEALYRHVQGDSSHSVTHGTTTTTEWSRSGWGYFVQAGMMLTDHFEASLRWSQLLAASQPNDPDLLSQIRTGGNEAGAALSYYIEGHPLKIQGDYFYLFGEQFNAGRHQFRLQIQASF